MTDLTDPRGASRVARASGPLLRGGAIGSNEEVTFPLAELSFRTAELTKPIAQAIDTASEATGRVLHPDLKHGRGKRSR
jgi:hypothetical protein